MPKKVPVDQFLKLAEKSGVLPHGSVEEFLRSVEDPGGSASTLADSMVKAETLTRWQADKLLEGRYKGFFLGNYRLLDLLGRGGMGVVYLAEHKLLNRRCAIKVLPLDRLHDREQLKQFLREARAVATLDHPNIVRAYDVDRQTEEGKDVYFLAMEYISGSDVRTMVRSSGPFDFVTAADITRHVAEGLSHAHANGLIHRDIKPSNLLVDGQGVAKILDLGLVTFFDGEQSGGDHDSLSSETLLGTADYVSPEQAVNSHKVDHRTDLYSLGCTFYFMLCGHPPFDQGSLPSRISAHRHNEPPPIEIERPGTPPELVRIVRKLMEKDLEDRYQTADDVAHDLARWLVENAEHDWKARNPSVFASAARIYRDDLEPASVDTVFDRPLTDDPDATDVGTKPLNVKPWENESTPSKMSPAKAQPQRRWLIPIGLILLSLLLLGATFGFLAYREQTWPTLDSGQARELARAHIQALDEQSASYLRESERRAAEQFVASHFETGVLPLSFRLDGESSSGFLKSWKREVKTERPDNQKRERKSITLSDPKSPLQLRCEYVTYRDFPVVEWTVFLKNRSTAALSPLVTELRGLDTRLECTAPDIPVNLGASRSWDAAREWRWETRSEFDDRKDYTFGWVAYWNNLDQRDEPVPGLQRWRSKSESDPWIARNVTKAPVIYDGATIEAGAIVMRPVNAIEGIADSARKDAAGLGWRCPKSGRYRLYGYIKNLVSGGDGVEWNIGRSDGKSIILGSNLNDSKKQPFETEWDCSEGEEFVLAMNARANDAGDLCEVQFSAEPVDLPTSGDIAIYFARGSNEQVTDFEPMMEGLRIGSTRSYHPEGGRPTAGKAMPFFNLGFKAEGIVVAVGWPGQWTAEFERQKEGEIQLRGGQANTHFRLQPGEEVRTPLIALQFYEGDRRRGQNLWRRWLLTHNLPRLNDRPVLPAFSGNSSHHTALMEKANESNQLAAINAFRQVGVPLNYWWMDAGWYVHQGGWESTGDWTVDPKRFPAGFRPVSNHARAHGIGTILWFEPERVTPGTSLMKEHPEWLLRQDTTAERPLDPTSWRLLDLGNPAARTWAADYFSKFIEEQGIDVYRQDFNIHPLAYWEFEEPDDRRGITENHYVTGYLGFWDELRRRHPGLLIDSCASGGRRNDLETLRRSVPLWRSDYIDQVDDAIAGQCHTMGMAEWYPYFGTRIVKGKGATAYQWRSNLAPSVSASLLPDQGSAPYIRKIFKEWNATAGFYFGDFYPLTRYSQSSDQWLAWQFHLPEADKGMIQAFRREKNMKSSLQVQLRGLSANKFYRLQNLTTQQTQRRNGAELMNPGLTLNISNNPGSAIIIYEKAD